MESFLAMNRVDILYEDNHIIVVCKPCNVLVQGDLTGDMDMLTLIKTYLKDTYNKSGNVYLGLVHRLDRPVSGVMVFAKTSKAASRLSKQIRDNTMIKKYMAVVRGIPEPKGDFEDYLLKTKDFSTIVVESDKGKYAHLSYSVVDVNYENNLSLVDILLDTGRHHQIRIQFATRGFSLYGDQRYGVQDKKQIALHAYSLTFTHPVTREVLTFIRKSDFDGVFTYFKF